MAANIKRTRISEVCCVCAIKIVLNYSIVDLEKEIGNFGKHQNQYEQHKSDRVVFFVQTFDQSVVRKVNVEKHVNRDHDQLKRGHMHAQAHESVERYAKKRRTTSYVDLVVVKH
jgi:hypothetical protein